MAPILKIWWRGITRSGLLEPPRSLPLSKGSRTDGRGWAAHMPRAENCARCPLSSSFLSSPFLSSLLPLPLAQVSTHPLPLQAPSASILHPFSEPPLTRSPWSLGLGGSGHRRCPLPPKVTSRVAFFFSEYLFIYCLCLLGCFEFVSAQGISDFHSGSHDF